MLWREEKEFSRANSIVVWVRIFMFLLDGARFYLQHRSLQYLKGYVGLYCVLKVSASGPFRDSFSSWSLSEKGSF